MSTYKSTSGDLTLTGNNGAATLTINYANTIFNGSFTYTGNLTTVDDFIVVAANNTGTVQDMGLLAGINVTTDTYAGFRFDTVANAWQVSSSVYGNGAPRAAYANIGGLALGSNTQVQYNNNGSLAGSTGFTFNQSSNAVAIGGALTVRGVEVLSNIGTAPVAVANSVSIYNNAPGTGQTGLYVTGNTIVTDEVISVTRAKLYSIIF
jgi:hypothetical protein